MTYFEKLKETHPEIVSMFQDKRVCLVAGGNVDSCGNEIDNNYDVVVRMNNIHYQYPVPEDVKKSHGARCDILFREHHQIWGIMNEMGDANYVDILRKIGVKKIIMWDGIGTSDEMVGRIKNAGDIPCYQLKNSSGVFDYLKDFFDEEHVIPTTGLMAIATIGFCRPKSLNLYGFTFSYDFICDSIYYPKDNVKQPNNFEKGSAFKHRSKTELRIFIELSEMIPMDIDKTMRKFIWEKMKDDNLLLHYIS